jgi:large subunit ribosomal protein L4
MATVNVLSRSGEVVGNLEMAEDFVNAQVNKKVLHQVVVAQLANMRSGTASTKTRAEVAGSGRKLYRQKGTGRARVGDKNSPTRVHGGVAFGPKPRSFRQSTPKKVRRLALLSALADKFQSNNVTIIDDINIEKPKTKEMVGLLQNLGLDGKILIVLDADNKNVYYSARNIPQVNVCTWNLLNTYNILWHDKLLMTQATAQKLEEKFQHRINNCGNLDTTT